MFLGEASRGFTLIVLVFAAMASLLLKIKTKVGGCWLCLYRLYLAYSILLASLKPKAYCISIHIPCRLSIMDGMRKLASLLQLSLSSL